MNLLHTGCISFIRSEQYFLKTILLAYYAFFLKRLVTIIFLLQMKMNWMKMHCIFLFFNKVKNVYEFNLSVCLYMHAQTLVNILQMFWNLYMLFMSNIAWTTLKMAHIGLMIDLQTCPKVFPDTLWPMVGNV